MIRKLVSLAVIVLVVLFFWRVVPPWMTYFDFQDQVREAARYSQGRTAEQVQAHIVRLAQQDQIPLDERAIKILKEEQLMHVELAYTENLQVLPGYFYPYEFRIEINTPISPTPPVGKEDK
jgi:hypothetical protein